MDRREPDYQTTGAVDRQDGASAGPLVPVSSAGEDAKSSELFRQGDDLYASGSYHAAIHVWTRILFLDRGNAEARLRIEKAKGLLAERQRRLDLETADAHRLFESGDVEGARKTVGAVLAIDSGHGEARELQSRIDALDRRNDEPRDPPKLPDALEPPTPAWSRRVVFRVPRGRGSSASRQEATSPLKMLAFLFGSVLLFGAAAFYLHENWDLLVSDGAFGHPSGLDSPLPSEQEIRTLPDRSELRYFNGARLFAEGRYREALSELSRVDPRSPVMADARSLILRIEERLLRGATDPKMEPAR